MTVVEDPVKPKLRSPLRVGSGDRDSDLVLEEDARILVSDSRDSFNQVLVRDRWDVSERLCPAGPELSAKDSVNGDEVMAVRGGRSFFGLSHRGFES